jgi:peptidoglycan biosynthesis protein MviN/MurJ (putative lipid II flippase)
MVGRELVFGWLTTLSAFFSIFIAVRLCNVAMIVFSIFVFSRDMYRKKGRKRHNIPR